MRRRAGFGMTDLDLANFVPSAWSGHVAFPGGRTEPDDESAEFTALRETWEGAHPPSNPLRWYIVS